MLVFAQAYHRKSTSACILIRNLIALIRSLMIVMFVMLPFILAGRSFSIYVGFINQLRLYASLTTIYTLSLLLIVVNDFLVDLWSDENLGWLVLFVFRTISKHYKCLIPLSSYQQCYVTLIQWLYLTIVVSALTIIYFCYSVD